MGRHPNSYVATTEWGALKQSNKYSTADIAKKLGVDKSSVVNWVSGKTIPNTINLRKLCNLYCVPVKKGMLMFRRDHKLYLEQHSNKNISNIEEVPTTSTSSNEVTGEPADTSRVHKMVFRAGESHKVVVRPTNSLKQLFGILVDARVDIASICIAISAYDQVNGDLIEMLNFIYLKVTAEDYRKICKAVDGMLR